MPCCLPGDDENAGARSTGCPGPVSSFSAGGFTVDPVFDTPTVLAAFGRKHKVRPEVFHLLTGPLDAVHKTVVEGLKIGMEPGGTAYGDDPAGAVHGTKFVLVDGNGAIRGYYDSDDPDDVSAVLSDARRLMR